MKPNCFPLVFLFLSACGQSRILNPATVDTDYAVQGEYLGVNTATNGIIGAQVSARGQGTFRVLLLNGGLPGQGWDGTGRAMLFGSLQGNIARFTDSGYNLSIKAAGDSLFGTNNLGQTLRLAKTYRQSATLGQAPPSGAIVLFDGSSISGWTGAILDSNHYLEADSQDAFASGGATTKQTFGDFTLHVEFYLPFEPANTGQDRANSGVYLQGRYELQILDSFGESFADIEIAAPGETTQEGGAIIWQYAAGVNMSLPPLTWQTYDIDFTAARWDSLGGKTQNAVVTVRQNGIIIHQNRSLSGPTPLGDTETVAPGPQRLQYHGHPVLFRNVWIIPQSATPVMKAPVRQGLMRKTMGRLYGLTDSRIPFFVAADGRVLGGKWLARADMKTF